MIKYSETDFPLQIRSVDTKSFQPRMMLVHTNKKIYDCSMEFFQERHEEDADLNQITSEILDKCEVKIDGFDFTKIPIAENWGDDGFHVYKRVVNTYKALVYLNRVNIKWVQSDYDYEKVDINHNMYLDNLSHFNKNMTYVIYYVDEIRAQDQYFYPRTLYRLKFKI